MDLGIRILEEVISYFETENLKGDRSACGRYRVR